MEDLHQEKEKWSRNIDSLGELLCQGSSDWKHLKQEIEEILNTSPPNLFMFTNQLFLQTTLHTF